MGAISFNEMEIDAIGEIMNISLGASATAVSTLLGATVNITTPVVKVASSSEFEFHKLEPAVGVEIAYVEGIEGSNIMMFSRNDVRIIVGMLMGMEIPEEEFELDEINRSAICEVMNQMMGSSATALSEFLGMTVNISTPVSFEVEDEQTFKNKYFPTVENRVVVRFALEVEGKLNSEFLNIMPVELAKRLLAPFEDSFSQAAPTPAPAAPVKEEPAAEPASGGMLSQEEIEKLLQGSASVQEETPAAPAAEPASGGMLSQEEIEKLLQQSSAPAQEEPVPQPAPAPQPVQNQPQAGMAPQQPVMPQMAAPAYAQPVYQAAPQPAADPMMLQLLNQMQQSQMQMMEFMKELKGKEREREPQKPRESAVIHSVNSSSFESGFDEGVEARENQEMLMKVPLEISVEIGRTKKKVKDILEFTQGSLVVLDKMAGEQADLYVNGQCIAKGDIVVVEDNFGIRVTEIISRNINPESL